MCGSRNFCQDGGRRLRPDGQKTVWTTFFFFSPQRFIQFTEWVQWFTMRKSIHFQGSRGGPILSRGSNFPEGSNFYSGNPFANFYRTPYNLWFSREDLTPYSPFGSVYVMIIDTKLCIISSHVFLVLKRIVPLRRFFLIPTAHVGVEVQEKYFDFSSQVGAWLSW